MIERTTQHPDTHIVLQFDDGIHITYKWATSDHKGKEGEVYKYYLGKTPYMIVIPTGMAGRLQAIGYPWYIDILGLFKKDFTMYRAYRDDVQAWPWARDLNPDERLSLQQVSALQFDSLGVKLSKYLTGSAFDMKIVLIGLAVVLAIGGGYYFFVKKDKNTTPKPIPTDNTPDYSQTYNPDTGQTGHWQQNNGVWTWYEGI